MIGLPDVRMFLGRRAAVCTDRIFHDTRIFSTLGIHLEFIEITGYTGNGAF